MSARKLVLLLGLLVIGAGCHAYAPIHTGVAPAPGQRVRLLLTDDASGRLGGQLGPRISTVEGDHVVSDATRVTIAIQSVVLRDGRDQLWSGERFEFQRSDIARLEERRLARGRTALATGGFVALVVALYAGTGSGGNRGRPIPVPPPAQ